jgi:hypothetical protein
MAEDIDRFIQEQKSKLARERNDLRQENNRKILDPNSSNNSPPTSNGHKENLPPSGKDAGNALPGGEQAALREKLNRERQEEYQKFLAQKSQRSAPRGQPQVIDDGNSLPIPSRDSAKARSRDARNKEYNDFLKNKGTAVSRKPRLGNDELSPSVSQKPGPVSQGVGTTSGPLNGHPPASDPRPQAGPSVEPAARREASSQTPLPAVREYDDRPPPGPPPGPRRGWGTPQPEYEEILRRKREEEARYRRYDDDFDYYQPRGGIRPSYSDPHLNRYPPEEGRYSRPRHDYNDQDQDRRRVRFTDERPPPDRGYPPPGATRYDRPPPNRPPADALTEPLPYDWNLSRGGRSRTLPELERQRSSSRAEIPNGSLTTDNVDGNRPRAKSASLTKDEPGLVIGNRDSASATKRKKEQYRKELEQQMREAQAAKKRYHCLEQILLKSSQTHTDTKVLA